MTTSFNLQNQQASHITDGLAILQEDNFNVNINSLHKIKDDINPLVGMLHYAVISLEMTLSSQQYWQLLRYLDTLLLWNKSYNLTAINQPREAMIKHIIDCLSIVPVINDKTKQQTCPMDLLDIGAGAGLPSVVVAICQPERLCTPVDSNQKKIRFIRQVASELGLKNVQPMATRIENFTGDFSLITSRAFASLTDFIALASPYLKEEGQLVAMKGKAPTTEELAELEAHWQSEVIELTVPYLNDSRHLVVLKKRSI